MELTGVIHMHSTYSYDGKVSLRDLKDLLIEEDISFACMTEHTDELTPEVAAEFVAECERLSDGGFVFIPGFEVPYQPVHAKADAHIMMIGATEFLGQSADADGLRAWREVSSLVILAHPVRNQYLLDEVMREVIDGVEIWNQQYEGKRAPRTRAYRLLETLRTERSGLYATGGLDLHRPEHLTFPRVTLETELLEEDSILETFQKGHFSFGSKTLTVAAKGEWREANHFSNRFSSWLSILVINAGKSVNKILKSLGLSAPSGLKQSIRSRV